MNSNYSAASAASAARQSASARSSSAPHVVGAAAVSQAAKQRAQGIRGLLLPAAAVPGAGDRRVIHREPACARRAQHRVDAGVLRGGREPRERALPGAPGLDADTL
jgi:hypothetical protein